MIRRKKLNYHSLSRNTPDVKPFFFLQLGTSITNFANVNNVVTSPASQSAATHILRRELSLVVASKQRWREHTRLSNLASLLQLCNQNVFDLSALDETGFEAAQAKPDVDCGSVGERRRRRLYKNVFKSEAWYFLNTNIDESDYRFQILS
ncbi:hypothetical protein CEXT_712271 [Caerostris extrusa]|uniref:Uncharacterized protein n=1 Tax=Caerostris extrusa TaxID=172846 RepID=A0AAV4UMX5_CAEEX|nr:hypothetical protein CEXT_712271 [Caerostris extrusa]